MQAPNPAVLDAVPSDLKRQVSAVIGGAVADADGASPAAGGEDDERGVVRLGPITLGTADTWWRFHCRQKFRINDKLAASLGAYYSFKDDRIGPTASLTYMLDANTKFMINEQKALLRRKWAWAKGNFGLGLAAECSLLHAGLAPGAPKRPQLHLGLDHVKPLKWELLGVGLVLAANLPFSLRDQELEKASFASRLLGFVRAHVKRTGYYRARVDLAECSGVLEL